MLMFTAGGSCAGGESLGRIRKGRGDKKMIESPNIGANGGGGVTLGKFATNLRKNNDYLPTGTWNLGKEPFSVTKQTTYPGNFTEEKALARGYVTG